MIIMIIISGCNVSILEILNVNMQLKKKDSTHFYNSNIEREPLVFTSLNYTKIKVKR